MGTSGERGQEIEDGCNNQLGGVEAVLEGGVGLYAHCRDFGKRSSTIIQPLRISNTDSNC